MTAMQTQPHDDSLPPMSDGPFRSLIRTIGLLQRIMQPYFARFGITGSQWAVLWTLLRERGQEPDGLRPTDIGERLLIRPPSVTGVIDRLEKQNLVGKESSSDDLRVKRVKLTPAGQALVKRILAGHQAQVDSLLGGLSTDEQAELNRLLGRLVEHLQRVADSGNASGLVEAETVQR